MENLAEVHFIRTVPRALDGEESRQATIFLKHLQWAVVETGAVETDIPGLWNVPGHPELTDRQLIDLASRNGTFAIR